MDFDNNLINNLCKEYPSIKVTKFENKQMRNHSAWIGGKVIQDLNGIDEFSITFDQYQT